MTQPYVGEIRMFAGDFAPAGWRFCDGSLLPISENAALFELIGTSYGGDGRQTFALPDLRGRIPIHTSSEFNIADAGGTEMVTLTKEQMPAHGHALQATSMIGTSSAPGNNAVGVISSGFAYVNETPTSRMADTAIGSTGRSRPHNNLQPFLCIDFIISLFGTSPTPS